MASVRQQPPMYLTPRCNHSSMKTLRCGRSSFPVHLYKGKQLYKNIIVGKFKSLLQAIIINYVRDIPRMARWKSSASLFASPGSCQFLKTGKLLLVPPHYCYVQFSEGKLHQISGFTPSKAGVSRRRPEKAFHTDCRAVKNRKQQFRQ